MRRLSELIVGCLLTDLVTKSNDSSVSKRFIYSSKSGFTQSMFYYDYHSTIIRFINAILQPCQACLLFTHAFEKETTHSLIKDNLNDIVSVICTSLIGRMAKVA